MNYIIDKMYKDDWDKVLKIYSKGIKTGNATFEKELPTWNDWNNNHIKSCRLVARLDKNILGWIALSPTSGRPVYSGVAEVSIYIDEKYRRKGIGEHLLKYLIELSEKNQFWTLQSAIIKENLSSIKLHEKCGFRKIGIREKIAKMNNSEWMDVILLERRSKIIGII
ncbi:GNAT family N-acetyltransferase [Clostridium weizhouense]|uniref:GNAT family N-acetyltransferase n=1 Tax=Clostridium weizhouense TaxID=2859781 RepID=A0ABS7AKC6_9CLOT|nr:GNAT family N-acetyltransferase [Clostridium weizhouense]MBW6409101.1 GNAT family N-acetyltransferase [Clostridium weizhouense]